MNPWKQELIQTDRGKFEIFVKGSGVPLCVTHLYSEFNESGDYFAETFTKSNKVVLVNLRETGGSEEAHEPHQLSMLETILDLEAIRKVLGYIQWGFAGHSTGGMLGILYGIYFSSSLKFNIIVGAAAREYMAFSADCIYNPNHPKFNKMQRLIEELKQKNLSPVERKERTIERTRLSLYQPMKYEEIFNKHITKKLSVKRIDFFTRELHTYDVTRRLSLIDVPTLIMCGRYDVQCPLLYSIEMNEYIADSRLVIFDKSNHYPFLEESELFLKAYQTFIKEKAIG